MSNHPDGEEFTSSRRPQPLLETASAPVLAFRPGEPGTAAQRFALYTSWLRLFVEPAQVVELRILQIEDSPRCAPRNEIGYYDADHLDELIRAAMHRAEKSGSTYFTLNPLHLDLLATRCNRIGYARRGDGASDSHVLRRRWLVVDADPVRPIVRTSATEAEKAEAHKTIHAVREHLRDLGWPEPILADSGNGYHLDYRIDLENNPEALALVRGCLTALAQRFDNDKVKVDVTLSNASRIIKLYGSVARKGDNVPERPWRRSRILEVPGWLSPLEPGEAKIEVVPCELLKVLAAGVVGPTPAHPARHNAPVPPSAKPKEYLSRLKVTDWLNDRGVGHTIKETTTSLGRTVWILDRCPFDPSHGQNGEVSIMQEPCGKMSAICMHNSCRGRGWQDFKAAIGRPAAHHFEPLLPPLPGRFPPRAGSVVPTAVRSEEVPMVPGYEPRFIDSATFAHAHFPTDWYVERLLLKGQPVVLGGPSKAMKTSVALDLAISLGSGQPFLGTFPTRKARVAIMSGESGEAVIQETARRICAAKGIGLASIGDHLLWGFRLPQLANPGHLACLRKAIEDQAIEAMAIDPLYLCLLSGFMSEGIQASNLYQIGPLLLEVARTCLDGGCTPVLVHHARKNLTSLYRPLSLEDLAFSGIGEFARQWIMVNRRENYTPGTGQHRLWLNIGGSAGQGGRWALDIDEGVQGKDFGGRRWEVTITEGELARPKQRATKGEEQQEVSVRILAALDQDDPGQKGMTQRRLTAASGLGDKGFSRALDRLLKAGLVERVPAMIKVANGAQRPGTVIRRAAATATASNSSEDKHHRRCPLTKGGNDDDDGGNAPAGSDSNLTTAA